MRTGKDRQVTKKDSQATSDDSEFEGTSEYTPEPSEISGAQVNQVATLIPVEHSANSEIQPFSGDSSDSTSPGSENTVGRSGASESAHDSSSNEKTRSGGTTTASSSIEPSSEQTSTTTSSRRAQLSQEPAASTPRGSEQNGSYQSFIDFGGGDDPAAEQSFELAEMGSGQGNIQGAGTPTDKRTARVSSLRDDNDAFADLGELAPLVGKDSDESSDHTAYSKRKIFCGISAVVLICLLLGGGGILLAVLLAGGGSNNGNGASASSTSTNSASGSWTPTPTSSIPASTTGFPSGSIAASPSTTVTPASSKSFSNSNSITLSPSLSPSSAVSPTPEPSTTISTSSSITKTKTITKSRSHSAQQQLNNMANVAGEMNDQLQQIDSITLAAQFAEDIQNILQTAYNIAINYPYLTAFIFMLALITIAALVVVGANTKLSDFSGRFLAGKNNNPNREETSYQNKERMELY